MTVWNFLSILLGAAGLVFGFLGTVLNRRSHRETLEVERFKAITAAHEGRIDDLEREVGDLKADLNLERGQHTETQGMLRIALRHIRALVVWGAGPRTTPMPEPPPELLEQL
ncbi:hypothetical protein [Mycobacterium malmoense]|uniref:hypothetical protein n=1 Tax=Mycobacterium malmoense TaxID=1780 RepID=UPI0008F82304|nr:hypothetical protein [Mycobacterium malmoense]OIN80852.1 hypothetical protein BMG05_10990 [Mycobacterium malmoense]